MQKTLFALQCFMFLEWAITVMIGMLKRANNKVICILYFLSKIAFAF
jgi:hypothetical protein